MTHDDEILISRCTKVLDVCRDDRCVLNVDHFDDSDEEEITAEEIHVTAFCGGIGGDVAFCFKLSTASARELVARL